MEAINDLSETKLRLENAVSALEEILEASEGSAVWSKDLGAFFEDQSERLNDMATRIAMSHRHSVPVIEKAIKHANRRQA